MYVIGELRHRKFLTSTEKKESLIKAATFDVNM